MTEELEHIIRAKPAWRRSSDMTECGRSIQGRATLTWEQFTAKVKRQGKTRASLTTCMTCWQTATRYTTWETNPVDVILRECERANWHRFMAEAPPKAVTLRDELLALTALAEAHREEFDELLGGLGQATELAAARRKRADRQRGGAVVWS